MLVKYFPRYEQKIKCKFYVDIKLLHFVSVKLLVWTIDLQRLTTRWRFWVKAFAFFKNDIFLAHSRLVLFLTVLDTYDVRIWSFSKFLGWKLNFLMTFLTYLKNSNLGVNFEHFAYFRKCLGPDLKILRIFLMTSHHILSSIYQPLTLSIFCLMLTPHSG